LKKKKNKEGPFLFERSTKILAKKIPGISQGSEATIGESLEIFAEDVRATINFFEYETAGSSGNFYIHVKGSKTIEFPKMEPFL